VSDLFAPEPQSSETDPAGPERTQPVQRQGGGGPQRPKRSFGWVAGVVALLVLVGVVVAGGVGGYHFLKDHLGTSASDYSGPGTGSVLFEVKHGDSLAAIGRNLKSEGVVKSVDAFIDAANGNPDSSGIQVGYYPLKKEMSADDALAVLVNPDNLVHDLVVVPEGARVAQIVKTIVAKTDISKADVVAALEDTKGIGLPDDAGGNPEGYLFPATYTVTPGETAEQLIGQMVAKTVQVDKDLDIVDGAKAVGLTPHQLITVASILEYEASRSQDYPKVARAIYNRLDKGMALQSDATVSYANGVSGQVWTTEEERNNPSPYNTYQHTGLPPGPIGSPGEETLKAAMHPASGSWLYWVVVNLKTGKTVFSDTLAEHNKAVAQFQQYCQTSDAC
jgi:UPF0755 protein